MALFLIKTISLFNWSRFHICTCFTLNPFFVLVICSSYPRSSESILNFSFLSFVFIIQITALNFSGVLLKKHPHSPDVNHRVVVSLTHHLKHTAQKMKFSIKDFVSKYDQIRSKLRIWSHLLKKSLTENFIFCAVTL